jgi:hypothetical protein
MRKGAIAAGVMMDYLEGKEIASRNIILPATLVERSSVADRRNYEALKRAAAPSTAPLAPKA